VTDRNVIVLADDVRFALSRVEVLDGALPGHWPSVERLRAALDAVGPEPCRWPAAHFMGLSSVPWFNCVLPKGHHALNNSGRGCCDEAAHDPIHCGDAHVPPAEVWAES